MPSTLQYKLWIPAFTDVHSDTHPMLKYLSLSYSSWKSAIFTRQLNSVQDTSLLLQVTRVIAVAVLNHLWNFSPNLWKVMKEGKKKKTNLKIGRKSRQFSKRIHIYKLIISAQRWSWPTSISHRYVCALKPGIKTSAVKQSSTPQSQKRHNPDNSVWTRNIFLMMQKCSYSWIQKTAFNEDQGFFRCALINKSA